MTIPAATLPGSAPSGPGAPPRPTPLSSYRTPGVRLEWLDASDQEPVLVRTDVAGLVGVAAQGPLHRPVRVESLDQFTGVFGDADVQGYLPDAVAGFFANGGRTCWVVRVADPAAAVPAGVLLSAEDSPAGFGFLRLTATSPGSWGNRIQVEVQPDPLSPPRFTLLLRYGGVQEIWRNLTRDATDKRDAARILSGASTAGSRLVMASWPDASPAASRPAGGYSRLSGGADGLATLEPGHLAGADPPSGGAWGVAALEAVEEVSLVCVPDCWTPPRPRPRLHRPRDPGCGQLDHVRAAAPAPPEEPRLDRPVFTPDQVADLQSAIVQHCERRGDRVALLDAPPRPATTEEVIAWRATFASSYAALYHPWIVMPDPAGAPGDVVAVPPSGHVAGLCARVDAAFGAHRPPAGLPLELAVDIDGQIDDLTHGDLNDAGVNVLRAQREVRVMGDRTLSDQEEWRYLNVRRLMLLVERSIIQALTWTTFEPNGPALWADVERVAGGVLELVWRQGMLDGPSPAQAYTVSCDATVNPPEETDLGRFVCTIVVNPPAPAEFVVIRITRTPTGLTAESSTNG